MMDSKLSVPSALDLFCFFLCLGTVKWVEELEAGKPCYTQGKKRPEFGGRKKGGKK
jgi:hypothetical protein